MEGRELISITVRYTDDMVLLADSHDTLQDIGNDLDRSGKKKRLMINKRKTKVMIITKDY